MISTESSTSASIFCCVGVFTCLYCLAMTDNLLMWLSLPTRVACINPAPAMQNEPE